MGVADVRRSRRERAARYADLVVLGQSGGPSKPRGHAGGKNAAGLSAYAAIAGWNERVANRADLPEGRLDPVLGRGRLSRQDRWSARRQGCQPALTDLDILQSGPGWQG